MHFSLINWITAFPPSHVNLLGRLPIPFIPLLSPRRHPLTLFVSPLPLLPSSPFFRLEVFQILLFTHSSLLTPFLVPLAHTVSLLSLSSLRTFFRTSNFTPVRFSHVPSLLVRCTASQFGILYVHLHIIISFSA